MDEKLDELAIKIAKPELESEQERSQREGRLRKRLQEFYEENRQLTQNNQAQQASIQVLEQEKQDLELQAQSLATKLQLVEEQLQILVSQQQTWLNSKSLLQEQMRSMEKQYQTLQEELRLRERKLAQNPTKNIFSPKSVVLFLFTVFLILGGVYYTGKKLREDNIEFVKTIEDQKEIIQELKKTSFFLKKDYYLQINGNSSWLKNGEIYYPFYLPEPSKLDILLYLGKSDSLSFELVDSHGESIQEANEVTVERRKDGIWKSLKYRIPTSGRYQLKLQPKGEINLEKSPKYTVIVERIAKE